MLNKYKLFHRVSFYTIYLNAKTNFLIFIVVYLPLGRKKTKIKVLRKNEELIFIIVFIMNK